MTGERLGRLSLRIDAVYCVTVGALVTATAGVSTAATGLPVAALVALGIAVVLWGAGVWWLTSAQPLRRVLQIVAAANVAAALGLALVSSTFAAGLVVITVALVAVDVALFAASQALALRRLAR